MLLPYSQNVTKILELTKARSPDEMVELAQLCRRVLDSMNGSPKETAALLTAKGSKPFSELSAALHKTAEHDSAVRDLVTTGHLGKLLSRLAFVSQPIEFTLIGLPSPLFDPLSKRERDEYLAVRQGFPQHFPNKEAVARAREILRREKSILDGSETG